MRQRRNKPPTPDVELPDDTAVKPKTGPALPDHRKRKEWHPRALSWWRRFWLSPMSDRLLESDVDELYVVLELVQRFWESPSDARAAELRRQTERFGKDAMSRRRLGWNVRDDPKEAEEDAAAAAEQQPKAAAGGRARPPKPRADPRITFRTIDGGKS